MVELIRSNWIFFFFCDTELLSQEIKALTSQLKMTIQNKNPDTTRGGY